MGLIPEPVGHALEDLDLVVDALQQPSVQGIAAVVDYAIDRDGEMFGERDQRRQAAGQGPPEPLSPRSGGRVAETQQLLEVVLEQ